MFILRLIFALTLGFSLSGCLATAIVGTATVATVAAHDDRPLGRQFDDAAIATKIDARLISEKNMPSRWVSIEVFSGDVTLTGYLPSQSDIDRAIYITRSVSGVRSVDSKIKVGEPKIGTMLSDSWITTRVKLRLLNDKVVSGLNIHVDTVNGKVYLQGMVNQAMKRIRAVNIAHSVPGVTAVVDLMQPGHP